MGTKHTPGPWKVDKTSSPSYEDDRYQSVYAGDRYSGGGKGFDLTGFLSNADAHLISAAPDLLEACITVVSGYEGDGMEQMGPRDQVFYKYCKQAIANATGGQNG